MKARLQQTPEEKEVKQTVRIMVSLVGDPGNESGSVYMKNNQDWIRNSHGQISQINALGSSASNTHSLSTVSHANTPSRITEQQVRNLFKKAKQDIDLELSRGNIPVISINLSAHGGDWGDSHSIYFGKAKDITPNHTIYGWQFSSPYKIMLKPIIKRFFSEVGIKAPTLQQAELITAKINEFLIKQAKKLIDFTNSSLSLSNEEKEMQLREAKKWNLDKNIQTSDEYTRSISEHAKGDVAQFARELQTVVPELEKLKTKTAISSSYKTSDEFTDKVVEEFSRNSGTHLQKAFESSINTSQSLGHIIAEELGLRENRLPITIEIDACHASAAVSMLENEDFPPGSVLFMVVNREQESLEFDEVNGIRNSASFIGTDNARLAIRGVLEQAKNTQNNISPVLAIKNSKGDLEIYDFQALLPEFINRVIGMSDDEMNALEEKFVRQYSPNDPDFRFNHFERIIGQIKNTAARYYISNTDQAEFDKLLDGEKIYTPEYEKIANEFYNNHRKIRLIEPLPAGGNIDNPNIPYVAARSMLLPIFRHAFQNLNELGLTGFLDLEYSGLSSLGKATSLLQTKIPNIKTFDFFRILKTQDDGVIDVVTLSKILNSLRNQIIEKYMDATPNPPLTNPNKFTIESEFYYSIKDQFKDTPEGGAAQLALHNLESILRGDIVESPLFNMQNLQRDFNENFAKGEQVIAHEIFGRLRDFKEDPENPKYDLKEILDMQAKKEPQAENRRMLRDYLMTIDFENIDAGEIAEILLFAESILGSKKSAYAEIEKLSNKDYGNRKPSEAEPSEEFIQKITEFLRSDLYRNADETQKKEKLEVAMEILKNSQKRKGYELLENIETATMPSDKALPYADINSIRKIAFGALMADKHDEILEILNKARSQSLPNVTVGEFGSAGRVGSGIAEIP